MGVGERSGRTNARPVLPTAEDSIWSRAAADRNRLRDALASKLDQYGYDTFIELSAPGSYPMMFACSIWLSTRKEETIEQIRTRLAVTIHTHPYHERPFSYYVSLHRKGRDYHRLATALTTADFERFLDFALGSATEPGAELLLVQGTLPTIEDNKVKDEYKSQSNVSDLFGAIGALAFFGAIVLFLTQQVSAVAVFGVVWLLASAVSAITKINPKERIIVVTAKPPTAPRSLRLIDSWSAVIPGVGDNIEALQERLLTSLKGAEGSFRLTTENDSRLTADGFSQESYYLAERNQAFVKIYVRSFGSDAFVGWDGFLNWLKWAESGTVSERREKGAVYEYRTVAPATLIPDTYDLMEANALSNLVHRRLTSELRLILKERDIEAEIDFSIIRGDRSEVGKPAEAEEKKKEEARAAT